MAYLKWKKIAGYGCGEFGVPSYGEYKTTGTLGKWDAFHITLYDNSFYLTPLLPGLATSMLSTEKRAKIKALKQLKKWVKGADIEMRKEG